MPKQSDSLNWSDRVMCLCGSINLRDYCVLDKTNLATKLLDLFDTLSAVRDYYFIFHDCTQTFHVHYVLCFVKQQYVSAIVNKLCETLNVEVEAVNYKKLLHRNAHLRYVLHIEQQYLLK